MRGHPRGSIRLSAPLHGAAAGRWRPALVAMCAAMVALWAACPMASAEQTHAVETSFNGSTTANGAFTDLGDIAIHQGTGTVYAIDRTNGVIDKFDAEGNPEDFSALGSSSLHVESTCPNFEFPPLPSKPPAEHYAGYYHGRDAIGVSSAGPTNGNIYVVTDSVDPGAPPGTSPGICAYSASGNFLWKDTEVTGDGLSVDGEGHLWVGAFSFATELENTGSPPEVLNVISAGGAERLAVDSAENVYINFFGDRRVDRYNFVGFQSAVQSGPTNAIAVNPATNHVYVATSREFSEYGANGAPKLAQAGEDVFSQAEGIAVNGSTGKVYVADAGTNRIYVFGPLAEFATVTTGAASEVRRTTATASGVVDPAGGGPVTGCRVDFGLTKAYGMTAPCNQGTPFSSSTPVTAHLTGMEGGKTYHYRVFATDAAGTNKGADQTFTTPFVSGVGTGDASNIDRTSVTLNGSLDPDGVSTTYYFQWGLTVGYGNTSPAGPPGQSVGSTAGEIPVSSNVTGLEPKTTYHYRLVGENATGKTIGEDHTFTTHEPVKDLATMAPTNVGPETASLNGTLDPDSFATHYYFEWGHSTSYGNVTPVLPGGDAGSTPGSETVSAEITDLDDYTTYHYRLVGTNNFGVTIGEDVEFLSAPPFLPVISSTEALSVTDTTATVAVEVNPGFGPTVYRFQYGTDLPYGSRTALSAPIGEDGTDHRVSVTFKELRPATAYHFRAVATNFSGSTGGEDATFTTAAPPGIDLTEVSSITQASARLSARVTPNSSPTTFHFEYGTDGSYGARTPESAPIGADANSYAVISDVGSLAAATTYHFRVVASNAYGTVSGPDQSFTTARSTGVEPPPEAKCKRGLKRRHGRCVKPHKQRKKHHRNQRGRRNG